MFVWDCWCWLWPDFPGRFNGIGCPFYKLFGADVSNQQGHGQRPRQGGEQNREQKELNTFYWDDLLAEVQKQNPNYKQISFRDQSIFVVQNKQFGNSRASDRYEFNNENGEITQHTPYAQSDRTMKVRGWIYSIHVGSWGGLFSKIITCIGGVIGGTLPLTGYYLWIRRSVKKRRIKSNKANWLIRCCKPA